MNILIGLLNIVCLILHNLSISNILYIFITMDFCMFDCELASVLYVFFSTSCYFISIIEEKCEKKTICFSEQKNANIMNASISRISGKIGILYIQILEI